MGKALDISLYKNGFGYQNVDCIQSPIAAAAGYFNHDNYFYYCFLHSIAGNFENHSQQDISVYSNKILCKMGLRLEKIDCSGCTPEDVISMAAEEILFGRPIIMIVKYNSLFYNMYYKNMGFRLNHGLLVNEFNESNKTFCIKDQFYRDILDTYKNAFFPLHITFDMLKNIWLDSNKQFRSQSATCADSIYSMYQDEEVELDTNKAINIALSIMDGKSELINLIQNFDGTKDFDSNIVFNRLRFCGCLEPIFHVLEEQCVHKSFDLVHLQKTKKKIEDIRSKVINALGKASRRCEKISKERKDDLCKIAAEGDALLLNLMKTLIVSESEKKLINHFVDITEYYNNQAFEESFRDDSRADITGEGTHYIFQDVVVNEEWKKGNFSFNYSYLPDRSDNISCNGQVVCIPQINAQYISILGCSEFGSYNEKIVVEYSDGSKRVITADFSDFFQPPIFGERAYWTGAAAERRNGRTRYHSFNARLFAKRYRIEPGCVVKIHLPNKRNVHIFALTLSDEVFL
ncbi:hypothetical protein [Ruminiclostridium cellulolyticum]|uniref:Butirosin biosynthesis protein H N-terminal domain-containing protein n=1 Tax=Ruminiclostridium cellulolyticum (strain ATCC 35319 / DSM 5812 / JCM 6584 / H10) TaxID=394503 RepID=B8I671_RUMCH|nr:hypothetical protein [Ruminiclostridium cellulolyticum]ACL76836.1 hypothetical protein Ccel_2508 [Ruminiclostridium cellulolyticum H10]